MNSLPSFTLLRWIALSITLRYLIRDHVSAFNAHPYTKFPHPYSRKRLYCVRSSTKSAYAHHNYEQRHTRNLENVRIGTAQLGAKRRDGNLVSTDGNSIEHVPKNLDHWIRWGRRRKGAKQLVTERILSIMRSGATLLGMKINTNTDDESIKIRSADELISLRQENEILRQTIATLEQENRRLEKRQLFNRIVIEQFEGEGKPKFDELGQELESWWDDDEYRNKTLGSNVTDDSSLISIEDEAMIEEVNNVECTELDDDSCPIEPDVSFRDALRDRAYWLVGLLVMQSLSGVILSRNEELLRTHPVIIYFLTMLVGAGGNAGNQASVRVIRGLALGTLSDKSQRQFLAREFKMAASLSSVLSIVGFIRASLFRTPLAESLTITAALALIVFSSICLGALLPLVLKKFDIDPAHSSTSIQVIMDILGVILTVIVSNVMLDSRVGQFLLSR